MTEAILMVVAMTAMCFMATCLVAVLHFLNVGKKKEQPIEDDPEEIERLERIAEQQKKDLDAWNQMMMYHGEFSRNGGDGQ